MVGDISELMASTGDPKCYPILLTDGADNNVSMLQSILIMKV